MKYLFPSPHLQSVCETLRLKRGKKENETLCPVQPEQAWGASCLYNWALGWETNIQNLASPAQLASSRWGPGSWTHSSHRWPSGQLGFLVLDLDNKHWCGRGPLSSLGALSFLPTKVLVMPRVQRHLSLACRTLPVTGLSRVVDFTISVPPVFCGGSSFFQ